MIEAFQALREIYGMVDDAAEALHQGLGVPLCVQCGRCCETNTPPGMVIEALYAVSVLAGTGRLSTVVKRAEGWLLDREDYHIYEGMPRGTISPQLRKEWDRVTYRPCPFMDGKICLIHEARPLVCRTYGVTRIGTFDCPRPVGRGETPNYKRWADGATIKNAREDMFLPFVRKQNPSWLIRGQIPTILFQAAEPKKFQRYVKDNRVASARLIGTDEDAAIFWQPQLEAMMSLLGR